MRTSNGLQAARAKAAMAIKVWRFVLFARHIVAGGLMVRGSWAIAEFTIGLARAGDNPTVWVPPIVVALGAALVLAIAGGVQLWRHGVRVLYAFWRVRQIEQAMRSLNPAHIGRGLSDDDSWVDTVLR